MKYFYEKFRIKHKDTICTFNAPSTFQSTMQLDDQFTISATPKVSNHIHWFISSVQELNEGIYNIRDLTTDGGCIAIYFPKKSSGIKTDLTRDSGWDILKDLPLSWVALVAYDPTWSALILRNTPPTKEWSNLEHGQANPFPEWIKPETKEIILPLDIAKILNADIKAKEFFDGLAWSHRREYLIWLLSAKTEATRIKRIHQFIARLNEGKKNLSVK